MAANILRLTSSQHYIYISNLVEELWSTQLGSHALPLDQSLSSKQYGAMIGQAWMPYPSL